MKFDGNALEMGAVSFLGHYAFDRRPQGISPRRLPDWTRAQLPQATDVMVRMPSGVRMVFTTDAHAIQLTVQTTRMVTPPASPRAVVFDLRINGADTVSYSSMAGNTLVVDPLDRQQYSLQRGDPYTVEFANLGDQLKHCELWLPHNAFVEIRQLEVLGASELNAVAEPRSKRWLHYGSSISHCMEAEQPTAIWPAITAQLAQLQLRNLGLAGQCHLDPFVARTIRDTDCELISIKTGINIINMDSMRERVFIPVLHGFLDTIREGRHQNTPLLLISPIYCPSAENQPGPTMANNMGKFITLGGHEEVQTGCLTLCRMREIMAQVVASRREAGDHNLHYIDGLTLFSSADSTDLPDDLHPNPEGYKRMGQRFAEVICHMKLPDVSLPCINPID